MKSPRRLPRFATAASSSSSPLLLLLLLLTGRSFCHAATDPTQVSSLLSLKDAWGGPSSWNTNSDPCSSPPWTGVSCNMNSDPNVVTGLSLMNSGLTGTLPTSLFTLTTLQYLDLSQNPGLGGTIPSAIQSLSSLTLVTLQNCSFSGNLPDTMGKLLDLTYIQIRQNQFSGLLPPTLVNLTKLYWFDITHNAFTGPLPEGFANITTLQHLHLSYNSLTRIPADISRLDLLMHLLVDNNQVFQPLPVGLLTMPSITIISLSNNTFLIQDSSELQGNSATLTQFVAHNAFRIQTPQPLPDFSLMPTPALQRLDLSGNMNFLGTIPSTISALASLSGLYLGLNNLNGSLPHEILALTKLEQLSLNNNSMSGVVQDLTSLSHLEVNLDFNNFSDILLANLNQPSGDFTFAMHLFGNPVCDGSDVPACLPHNCTVITSDDALEQKCGVDLCSALAAASPSGGVFKPNPAEYAISSQCSCASPLVANLSLPMVGFPTWTPSRATQMRDLTVTALNAAGITISADQVAIPLVVQECNNQFEVTMEFYPPPSSQGGAFNYSGIQTFLSHNPGFLDNNTFGLQYPITFVPPGTYPPSQGLSTGAIVGIVVGSVVAAALVTAIIAYILYRRVRAVGPEDPWTPEDEEKMKEVMRALQGSVVRFKLSDLQAATNNFSPELVLGVGGYGEVYKGKLEGGGEGEGVVVAVKRAKSDEKQKGGAVFRNEIELLSKVRHKNLVELKGFCRESGEQLLVYEFVSQGTLAEWLHPKAGWSKPPLSWSQRMQIAVGSAQGLAYLHHEIQPPIIHRDIKGGNILIDSNMNAKVADFGLSKEIHDDTQRTEVIGTPGYLDPEYYLTDLVTEKSDVYSFGVVLLELATGKRVFHGSMHVRQEVAMEVNAGGIASVVDPSMQAEGVAQADLAIFEAFLRLAMQCCTKKATARPSMQEVLSVLIELQSGVLGSRRTMGTLGGSTYTQSDTAFATDEDDDDPHLHWLQPRTSGSASGTVGAGFSEESGAFVGRDGVLYDNSGVQSGVPPK